MSGEGTGGGGALAALLILWIAAMVFVLGDDSFGTDEPPVAESPAATGPATTVAVDPEPQPTPRPSLPECEGDACDEPVTRAELAAAFSRIFRLPVTTADYFRDDAGIPEQPAINRFAAAGITSGCAEGRFCPDGDVTRAQMATFLDRVLDLPEADRDYFTDDDDLGHQDAINRIAAAGLTVGCGEERYCPNGEITRRQLITFLDRALDLQASA